MNIVLVSAKTVNCALMLFVADENAPGARLCHAAGKSHWLYDVV